MSIKDGWFSESEVLWPGQKFSLEVMVLLLLLCGMSAILMRLYFYAKIFQYLNTCCIVYYL